MKKMLVASLIISTIISLGCSSGTKITSSWKSPAAPSSASAYKNVMVLALLSERDRSLQQSMEKEMVDELAGKGISAASAYETFGPGRFSTNEKLAVRQLKKTRADAVMTITLLDKTKESNYVPGNVTFQPLGVYYNRFSGYYNYAYNRMYNQGYYTTNTNYFWESNLYDLKSNKLVYSVQTESFDPASAQVLSKDYSRKIVENMMKQGVLTMR
jgi:hypothetical protein